MKSKVRERKKGRRRTGLAILVAVLIVSVSALFIHSMLNQLSTNPVNSSSERKAAILDHLSLTMPNQTFVDTATSILQQAGYSVDYYQGEKVTVDLFRNLPTYGYSIVILRVHSGANADLKAVGFFTAEPYSTTKYLYEQLDGQLVKIYYNATSDGGNQEYFGINKNFIEKSAKGTFPNATIIMMGCEGLAFPDMAKAFVGKGAKVYVGWSGPVSGSHTDEATICLLQHLVLKNETIRQGIENTIREVGTDPAYQSQLVYYPSE